MFCIMTLASPAFSPTFLDLAFVDLPLFRPSWLETMYDKVTMPTDYRLFVITYQL